MDNELLLTIHKQWGSLRKNGSFPPFFPAAQPVSLEKKHITMIRTNNYFVSEKTDGIRMGLICIGKTAILVDRKMKSTPVHFYIPDEFYNGTMLDGEMMSDGTYVVYDMIMICGKNIRNLHFNTRLYYMHKYLHSLPVVIKKFYLLKNIRYLLQNLSSKKADGLIFTPCDEPVKIATHNTMFKWKSVENITIDFRTENGKIYLQNRNVPVYVTKPLWANEYPDNTIVECSFSNNTWKPIKVRTDKDYPNSVKTFDRTMKSIRENITIQYLQHSI